MDNERPADSGTVDSEAGSVTESPAGFSVGASPFNEVKLDLAIVLVIGLLLVPVMLSGKIVSAAWLQSAILGGFGLLGFAWLVFRVRRILERVEARRLGG